MDACATLQLAGITQNLSVAYQIGGLCSRLNFPEQFDYWVRDCSFQLCLHRHAGWYSSVAWRQTVCLPSFASFKLFPADPGWWRGLKESPLLCVPTPPFIAYYYGYILTHFVRPYHVWHIVISEFVISFLISFLLLPCDGTNATVFANSFVLSAEKGAFLSLPSRLFGNFEQYDVFNLLLYSVMTSAWALSPIVVLMKLIGVASNPHCISSTLTPGKSIVWLWASSQV